MPKKELVFLPLGGSGEIGMNMNLYGYGSEANREWIMIDCGVMFGGPSTPGVDLICPDPSFILEEKENLHGLLLTHGHEDHIGAVAILAPKLGCPVYATPFTAALVQRKLAEYEVNNVELHVIEMNARFKLGPFDIEYITLTHSIPEPSGVALRTDLGTVLHTGDWKIDASPTLGPVTDSSTIKKLGDDGLLAMVCDSTNVLSAGESGSESAVRKSLVESYSKANRPCGGDDLCIQSLSRCFDLRSGGCSGQERMPAGAIDVADCRGGAAKPVFCRKGCRLLILKKLAIYRGNMCFTYAQCSQGEPRAALARIARGDHRDLVLSDGDTVIFSSKIIPGNEREIFTSAK